MQRSGFRFLFPFRVRYSEVDGQSVVFNAHYLTYFDTSITEFFRWLGYDYVSEVKATGVDFHTVKSLVEYKAPIRFDEEIEVGVRIGAVGNSSLRFELAIFAKGADDLRDGRDRMGLHGPDDAQDGARAGPAPRHVRRYGVDLTPHTPVG